MRFIYGSEVPRFAQAACGACANLQALFDAYAAKYPDVCMEWPEDWELFEGPGTAHCCPLSAWALQEGLKALNWHAGTSLSKAERKDAMYLGWNILFTNSLKPPHDEPGSQGRGLHPVYIVAEPLPVAAPSYRHRLDSIIPIVQMTADQARDQQLSDDRIHYRIGIEARSTMASMIARMNK